MATLGECFVPACPPWGRHALQSRVLKTPPGESKMQKRRAHFVLALWLVVCAAACAQTATKPQPEDIVIKNGTILTVTHGTIQNGSIYIHNGKIAEVGKTVNAPANAKVID